MARAREVLRMAEERPEEFDLCFSIQQPAQQTKLRRRYLSALPDFERRARRILGATIATWTQEAPT